MKFAGKYAFTVVTPDGGKEAIVNVRANDRAYEGEFLCDGTFQILENVVTRGEMIAFDVKLGPCVHTFAVSFDSENHLSGTETVYTEHGSDVMPVADVAYSPKKLRALILYATMTKNTEKIAAAMKETFEHYGWEVTYYRMTMNPKRWEGMQEQLYFDDYDVIALGSPIVAGYPLTVVNKVFSLGAGGELENNVQKQVDAGGGFEANSDTIKPPPGQPGPGGPGGPEGPGGPPPKPAVGASWRRKPCLFPGGPSQYNYRPIGLVFTTYGGGFFGSNEALATLSALKLFLELQNVDVIAQFACVGKEFGPAGLVAGEKPFLIEGGELPDAKIYELEEGEQYTSSYFFHGQPWEHPNDKDVIKAKILVSDLVEDMFMTYDGRRAQVKSEYISIS